MNCRPLTRDEYSLWNSFVAASPYSSFMQSNFWADYKLNTGWHSIILGVFDNQKLLGGTVLLHLKTSPLLYAPQGPILSYDSKNAAVIIECLISYIRDFTLPNLPVPISHLRIEPRLNVLPSNFPLFIKAKYNIQPKSTLLLDLRQDESELLADMKPKARYNILIAEKHNVFVEMCPQDSRSFEQFYALYYETAMRQHFSPKLPSYFSDVLSALGNEQAKIFIARDKDGAPLSTALVIFFGGIATYFFGASSSEHREMMSSYLLHWKIIRYAKSQECHTYDFWGITADTENRGHPWFGFTRFKRQFGGREANFVGCLDFAFDQTLYENFLRESGEAH